MPRSTCAEIPPNPGKSVPRGFPRVLCASEQPPIREGSGRRELARWLSRPRQSAHGAGHGQSHLAAPFRRRTGANVGEFRRAGRAPSHPELARLSWPHRFVASGWSIKAMHRLMMLSSTYQQSSRAVAPPVLAADPENRLLWRVNRRRLEAEAIRDSLLRWPAGWIRPPGVPGFRMSRRRAAACTLMSVRTGAKTAEFGPLFDAPDCSAIVERRTQSIVAPQALFFMNDPFVLGSGHGTGRAHRPRSFQRQRPERIERLYEITLGRPPTAAEVEIGLPIPAGSAQPTRPGLAIAMWSCARTSSCMWNEAATTRPLRSNRRRTAAPLRGRFRCACRWPHSWPTSRSPARADIGSEPDRTNPLAAQRAAFCSPRPSGSSFCSCPAAPRRSIRSIPSRD